MPRELRGRRYLDAEKGLLEQIITNKLPYLDYKQACSTYNHILNSKDTTNRDKALLGCNDRFFLLMTLLGRHDVLHPWLYYRCREVEADPDGHLDLWARFHYKSTIITFGGIIQEILCDPDITICIFSHTKDIARAFLEQIQTELEVNEELKTVYPDVLFWNPRVEAQKWSKTDGIIVRRSSNPKEATVEAHGLVDGQPTSRHYHLMVYDDIVTEKSITGPEMIRKTTISWENSDNLARSEGARKQVAGTRWSFGDSYGIMLDRKVLKPRIYPATEDGTLRGRPTFLTQERWNDIKKWQRSTVSAQMLLNPAAGTDAMFRSEWFRGYDVVPSQMNVYIMCDPSKGRSKDSDRTAIAVVGVDVGGNKFLLDGVRHRMRLSERYDWLKRFWNYWSVYPGVQSCKVGYEIYGAQADTEVIEEYQQRDKLYFEVEELNYPRQGPHSKNARVERLEPDMRYGRFYMPSIVYHPDVGSVSRNRIEFDGVCSWSVWQKEDNDRLEKEGKSHHFHIGQIIYRPQRGLTRMQRWCENTGQLHRIVKPLRRYSEDREIYDLTRCLMEEARFFPFAPHDDLIDVIARCYDMDVQLPVKYDINDLTGLSEHDYVPMIEGGSGDEVGTHYDA